MPDTFLYDITVGATNIWIPILLDKVSDGLPDTGMVAANLTAKYVVMGSAIQDVTGSLNNLAGVTSAHNDWGVIEYEQGLYRLDVADAIAATANTTVLLWVISDTPSRVHRARFTIGNPLEYTIHEVDMAAIETRGVYADRSPFQAIRAHRNKRGFPGGVYTVYKEDDTTVAWTAAVTTDRNYFSKAELIQPTAPQRVHPQTPLYQMPLVIRQGA